MIRFITGLATLLLMFGGLTTIAVAAAIGDVDALAYGWLAAFVGVAGFAIYVAADGHSTREDS